MGNDGTAWTDVHRRPSPSHSVAAVTHRRSIAQSGGSFQRRLFACQHDNFRTIKGSTMKLGGYVHSTKISPEFDCQGQRSRSPGTKTEIVRQSVRQSSSGARSSCGILFGAVLWGAVLYAGGKISACCLVSYVNGTQCLQL